MANKRKRLIACALLALALPAMCLAGAYYYFSHDLPRISSLQDYRPPLVSQIYSRRGGLLGEFFIERRYQVGLDDISPLLIKAIIAAEDDRFFEHSGINLWSIVRAAIKNVRSFEIKQGGSTITQQIVKSILLTPEKSFTRKIREAILATRIEKYLSKDDILTLYLNQIYFGRSAYGIEAAARVYFDKPASELTLAEAALLAGMPKAPSYYSPFRNPQRAKERQSYVLKRMVQQGDITVQEKAAAESVDLQFAAPANSLSAKAPYFVEDIRKKIEKRYGKEYLYREGLRIETTLDVVMQEAARKAVARGIGAYEQRQGPLDNATRVQAALICLDPYSGHVYAMVGGRDFRQSQFNRAVQAQRQPGSAFKPIIYAAALDKGYTPSTMIIDSPLVFENKITDKDGQAKYQFWEPHNYDEMFRGPITFRKALTQSRNIVTIKILREIGVGYAVRYAQRLGMQGTFHQDLTLSLGTCGISLLNMVKAYSAFCAQGVSAEPIMVTRILDREGAVVEENLPSLVSAISPQTAYIMTTLLESVVEEGTGRRVRSLRRPCAGKTGTTNDVRDAWFIGYTPQLVTGVWVGFDDLKPLGKKETGARAASPIWLDFMKQALADQPVSTFAVPDGIVFVAVNPETGYFPSTRREPAVFECFKEGTVPRPFLGTYSDPGRQEP